MASYQRLAGLLPSLYRPEPDDDTLLNALLASAGAGLDSAAVQLQHALRAHWFDVADKASWDAHYLTERGERGLPPINVRDAKDQREIRTYPYITDLARLGALVGVSPWRDGPAVEGVEEYRQRIADLLEAYRLGLTTLPALRRLVEAALPEDMAAELPGQRWPFAIEEPVALRRNCLPVVMPAVQEGERVCPLFRWQITQGQAASPTVYVQGVAEEAGLAAATVAPLIERLTPAVRPLAVGLAYRGTLAAGQTLRLSPARRSWLALAGEWRASPLENAGNCALDPAANGPWNKLAGVPAGQLLSLTEACDRSLWALMEQAGGRKLFRFDGKAFIEVIQDAPVARLRALQAWGDGVYIGTDQGLYRVDLFPASGQPWRWAKVAQATDPVNALALCPSGQLALATAQGAVLLGLDYASNAASVKRYLNGVALNCLHVGPRALHAGFAGGVLQLNLGNGQLLAFEGANSSEQLRDWRPLASPAEATSAEGWLPAVHHIAVTPDDTLWLATEQGLARYGAWEAEAGVPRTALQAFADLIPGQINRLRVDERGMLWIAAANGLFRFDGRDLARYDHDAARWQPLGEADALYPEGEAAQPRGQWRFDRSAGRWQCHDLGTRRFAARDLALRVAGGTAVADYLLTDSVRAELGSFDGSQFSPAAEVPASQLVVRVKPEETRIVDGGLPALPRAAGTSTWRYLQLEPEALVVPVDKPWWSVEGRLFPPSSLSLPLSGHYRANNSAADGRYDQVVYSYPASAKLWLDWAPAPRVGVRVRLFRRAPDQAIDPVIIERVWAYLSRAKGAGIPMQLCVEGVIVKGECA